VDIRVKQKGPTFSSHKLKKKSALQYEVGVGIMLGDITIFRDCLESCIDQMEKVEADDGYHGDLTTWKVPADVLTQSGEEEDKMQMRVQGHHETINAHLKFFKILGDQPFRHDETQHGYVFRAVAVLVQIALKNGDPLFQVDYKVTF
jgi:hypothetical protein